MTVCLVTVVNASRPHSLLISRALLCDPRGCRGGRRLAGPAMVRALEGRAKGAPIAESLADGLGGSWRMPFRSRHARSSSDSACTTCVNRGRFWGSVASSCWSGSSGGCWLSRKCFPRRSEWYGFAGLSLVLAAVVYPSLAFHADQRQRGYRFLSHRGVTPRKAWWSRQLVWGAAYVLLTGVLLLSFVMGASLEGVSRCEKSGTTCSTRPDGTPDRFHLPRVLGAGVRLRRVGLDPAAQRHPRRRAGGDADDCPAHRCAACFGRYAGWSPVWLDSLGLARGEPASRRRLARRAAQLAKPPAVDDAGGRADRPTAGRDAVPPDPPDPLRPRPGLLAEPARSASLFARGRRAARRAGRHRGAAEGNGRSRRAWRRRARQGNLGKRTEKVLSDEAVKRLVAFTADWPKPAPYVEPIWTDSWASLRETPAGRSHPGPLALIADLMGSLGASTENYERTGRPREALDCRIAFARLSVGMGLPQFQNGLVNMRGWARSPGMTPELLKEAISRLDGLAPDRLDYTLGLKSWYLVIQRDITDDEYFFMDVGERPTSRVLLPVLYPWERTRCACDRKHKNTTL